VNKQLLESSFLLQHRRFAWRVTGAHDLAPITTHGVIRLERYRVPYERVEAEFAGAVSRDSRNGRGFDLAHVPDVPTGDKCRRGASRSPGASRVIHADHVVFRLEHQENVSEIEPPRPFRESLERAGKFASNRS